MCSSGSDGDGDGHDFVAHARYTCIQPRLCAFIDGRVWGGLGPTTFTVIPFCASLKTLNYLSFHSDTAFPSYQTNYFPLCDVNGQNTDHPHESSRPIAVDSFERTIEFSFTLLAFSGECRSLEFHFASSLHTANGNICCGLWRTDGISHFTAAAATTCTSSPSNKWKMNAPTRQFFPYSADEDEKCERTADFPRSHSLSLVFLREEKNNKLYAN